MKALLTPFLLLAAGSVFAFAQEAPPESSPAPAKKSLLKYSPPKGKAESRIDGDGGSRGGPAGSGPGNLSLQVLVPDGVALTSRPQPSLFYYLSTKPSTPSTLTFAVVEEGKPEPLFKAEAQTGDVGIRRVALSRYGVQLKPGVRYRWSVALGSGADGRSQDVFSSGSIRYEPAEEPLKQAVAKEREHKAVVYAEHGYWYDALEELADRLVAKPGDALLLEMRQTLLTQAGLGKIAAASKAR